MIDEKEPQNDRGRFLVLFLLLVTTVFSAILAGLQADSSIRAEQANIQSQYYAVQASAEIFREGQQSAFDMATLSTYMRHLQEKMVLEYSALLLEGDGDQNGAARLMGQAQITGARAEAAKQVSFFYSDPRYAPLDAASFPDLQAYLSDHLMEANALVEKQNAASDAYHYWDEKGNSYLTLLSILALVFFLLGVAQNARRLRTFFTVTALIILFACGIGTISVLLS